MAHCNSCQIKYVWNVSNAMSSTNCEISTKTEKGHCLGDRTDDNIQSSNLSSNACVKYTTGSQTTPWRLCVCVSFAQEPCTFTLKHGKWRFRNLHDLRLCVGGYGTLRTILVWDDHPNMVLSQQLFYGQLLAKRIFCTPGVICNRNIKHFHSNHFSANVEEYSFKLLRFSYTPGITNINHIKSWRFEPNVRALSWFCDVQVVVTAVLHIDVMWYAPSICHADSYLWPLQTNDFGFGFAQMSWHRSSFLFLIFFEQFPIGL